MSKLKALSVLAVGVFFVAGCGNKENSPAPTPVTQAQVKSKEKNPEQYFRQFCHEEPGAADAGKGIVEGRGTAESKYLASEQDQLSGKKNRLFQLILSLNCKDNTYILHYEQMDDVRYKGSMVKGKVSTVDLIGNWRVEGEKLILEKDDERVATGEMWNFQGTDEKGNKNVTRQGIKLNLGKGFNVENFNADTIRKEKGIEMKFVSRNYLPQKEMTDNDNHMKVEEDASFRSVQVLK